jgi:hypothetical protein
MVGGSGAQNIFIEVDDNILTDASVRVGFRRVTGVRYIYADVFDTAGNGTFAQIALSAGDVEHTAKLTFIGNNWTLYLDDVSVATGSPVLPCISTIRKIQVGQQPVNVGTNMSISKVEITTCE